MNVCLNLSFYSDFLKVLYSKSGRTPFKYKFWELEIYLDPTLIHLEVDYTTNQDHAGLRLNFGLLFLTLEFHFHDSRHWDYETNSWEVHENR
jgi:hypothetical protein